MIQISWSSRDKDTFSSLAPSAWLRDPSALIQRFRIVLYNDTCPGAMRFCLVAGRAPSALRDRSGRAARTLRRWRFLFLGNRISFEPEAGSPIPNLVGDLAD